MPNTEVGEIAHEQEFVDRAYEVLDRQRAQFRATQRQAEAQGAWGTPQARTERDVTAAHYGDRAARLERIEDRLVFGRLDNDDQSTMYVGRAGLKSPDGTRLLTDWRAPAATPFYQATGLDPQGVARRRHISTRMRTVVGVEDELLNSKKATHLQFQGEGALMAAVGAARDGHMGDIVATIQAEQDRVIRADTKGVLVVQGGPGTGKTAVALHRAAYLLYNQRERLERSGVLIVGPTRAFLRYIEQVLPSLGETGVVSLTMGDLLPEFSAHEVDPPAVAQAKGNLAWIDTLKNAVRDLQRLPNEDVVLHLHGRKATLTIDMVRAARTRARRTGKAHNEARDSFALELIDGLATQLASGETDADTLAWWRDIVRESKDARREINLCWMPTTPTTLLSRLYARPDYLTRVNRGLSTEQIDLCLRAPGGPWAIADVPLLDELDELLGYSSTLTKKSAPHLTAQRSHHEEIERAQAAISGQDLGGGLVDAETLARLARGEEEWKPLSERAREDRAWAYGHVVVDEAQELTPMMWHSLLRRCPSRSFTVVGDLDQARGNRPSSWYETLGPAGPGLAEECVLTISYRTPRTLTDLAQNVQEALGYPVHFPVVAARDLPDALAMTQTNDLRAETQRVLEIECELLDESVGEGLGQVAIILSEERARTWGLQPEVKAQRVSILTPLQAKGLEFDVTILVEPSEILTGGPGDLFVAMTRSTRRLHAVHAQDLPAGWTGQVADN